MTGYDKEIYKVELEIAKGIKTCIFVATATIVLSMYLFTRN